MAYVAKRGPGPHLGDAQAHRLLGKLDQPPREDGGVANHEHLAGIAVIAVLDDGDVDVDDVAVLQPLVAWNAVADLMVHRGADGFRKAAVVEGCGDRVLLVDDEIVTDAVELVGRHSWPHVRLDHLKHLRRQPACDAHLRDLVR